jgi:GNAT superfamily N-acetyltransferase
LRRAGIVQGKRAGVTPMTETVIASRMVGGRRFEIDTDPTRLDIALIHHFLAKCSHWARDIPLDTLHRALAHSLVFGIYREGTQVGFARIVTDQATFAYLADVFVVAEERNAGLGQWLIETILASSAAAGPAALAAGNQERQKSLFALRFCRIITGRLVSGAV